MKSFISLEEAIEMLNENVKTMEVEEVQLIDAIDKVLAEDVYHCRLIEWWIIY